MNSSTVSANQANGNRLGTFLIIVLLCGITGFGGYYFGQKKSSSHTMAHDTALGMDPNPGMYHMEDSLPAPSTSAVAAPTQPPTRLWGPESLWSSTEQGGASVQKFLEEHLKFTPPAGWYTIACGNSINLTPPGGVQSCGTEGNAFAINMMVNSPYLYQVAMSGKNGAVSDKTPILIDGRAGELYMYTVAEGQGAGKTLQLVIFYDAETYIYIALHNLEYRPLFDEFVASLQIK